jgi:hypothetical protein
MASANFRPIYDTSSRIGILARVCTEAGDVPVVLPLRLKSVDNTLSATKQKQKDR